MNKNSFKKPLSREKNHYVPQFILKGFSFNKDARKPRVYFFPIAKMKEQTILGNARGATPNTKDIFVKKSLYEDETDKIFIQGIESNVAPIVANLIKGGSLQDDDPEIEKLSHFLLLQMARTSYIKERIECELDEVEEELRKNGAFLKYPGLLEELPMAKYRYGFHSFANPGHRLHESLYQEHFSVPLTTC